jgi:hypothetical protein
VVKTASEQSVRFWKPGGCAIHDGDDGQPGTDSRVDAQDPHGAPPAASGFPDRGRGANCVGENAERFFVLAECLGAVRAAVYDGDEAWRFGVLTRHNSSPGRCGGSGFSPVSCGKFGAVERTRNCPVTPLQAASRRRLIGAG